MNDAIANQNYLNVAKLFGRGVIQKPFIPDIIRRVVRSRSIISCSTRCLGRAEPTRLQEEWSVTLARPSSP